jgi:uncharacterized membrane protein YfcA
LSTETLIAIALIAFLAAVCQSVTAFGFALVMVPLLAVVWEVKPAVVTSTLLSTVFMVPLLYQVRAKVQVAAILPLLAGSLAGIPVGLAVLKRIDAGVLQVLVALMVVVACLTLFWSRPTRAGRPHAATAFFAGGISGALRGATSMSGPPIVLYALSAFGDEVDDFRANVLGVLLPSSLVTIAGLAVAGLIDGNVGLACLAAAPTMVAGTITGAWLRRRVSAALFRPVVLSVLVGSSAVVLISALTNSV